MAVELPSPSSSGAVHPEDGAAIQVLVSQRDRRDPGLLYDAVRASALKIAEKKHWNIEFVKE